ncbi:3-oxoacyl-[acyl-carrier-protein] synthase III C-terminal domain-containing protein [Mycobacterium sp. B14F4]|uniref:3-oxoacyl-[acyl-carrier-protein] synthase III C-terminal domain-containing protein n=1 Tax=Mycobacterium sp. B14F4 TaxID=3153565 RepID=UPI00325DF7E2
MGTVIERVAVLAGGWRHRHSALGLAVETAKDCLRRAEWQPHEVDLLVNAGIYRDRNLGEPALAALIQQDIGANPERPHAGGHGTFSFDVANGTCGLLNALQIVDGFLTSRAVERAMVVASDADPGHRMSDHFPFTPAGAAMLCQWRADDSGLSHPSWVTDYENREMSSATVGLVDGHNTLRVARAESLNRQMAAVAAKAIAACLEGAGLRLADVRAIVAAPGGGEFRAELAHRVGLPEGDVVVAEDERMHTASLAAALDRIPADLPTGSRILLVAAGAGICAGAAVYRVPPAHV